MTTITIQDSDVLTQREDVADALLVANNLRYATMDGTPHEVTGGELRKGQSRRPLTVTVKKHANGEKVTFKGVKFFKELENMTYLSGSDFVERVVGKVVRVKRVVLP